MNIFVLYLSATVFFYMLLYISALSVLFQNQKSKSLEFEAVLVTVNPVVDLFVLQYFPPATL